MLSAGNLLVAPGSLFLIDWEFGTFGPVAFDVGCLLGNLALAVLSLKGMHEFEAREQQDKQHKQLQQPQSQSQHTRREQAEWLLQVSRIGGVAASVTGEVVWEKLEQMALPRAALAISLSQCQHNCVCAALCARQEKLCVSCVVCRCVCLLVSLTHR